MTRTVAIVQARMGSSRLPGKVLEEIAGTTMLGAVVERLQAAATITDVVIATTRHARDIAIVAEAGRLGVRVHRGPEDDVLSRYVGAARETHAEVVVRVPADCPLLDPAVVDDVVIALAPGFDYASNTHVRTYPRGLDVEALHVDTLWRLDRLARTPATREHVTSFVMEAPSLFRIHQVVAARDDHDLRWTVDTPEDLAMVRELVRRRPGLRPYHELVELARTIPEIAALNAHVVQKSWSGHA